MPVASSASGHDRMVDGRATASGKKWMDASEEIAWFGNMLNFGVILTEKDRSSRSCPDQSLAIRLSVSGSSQRGKVCVRPERTRWRGVGQESGGWRVNAGSEQ